MFSAIEIFKWDSIISNSAIWALRTERFRINSGRRNSKNIIGAITVCSSRARL